MPKGFNHDNLEAVMNKLVKISKLFLVLALLPASTSADPVFSNLEITSSQFSVDISGTFTTQLEDDIRDFSGNTFFFLNSNLFADPGFVLVATAEDPGHLLLSGSFNGSYEIPDLYQGGIDVSHGEAVGQDVNGDGLKIKFELSDDQVNTAIGGPFSWVGFQAGDSLNGTFSATFPNNTFNLSGASSVNVYLGDGGGPTMQSGVYLGSLSNPAYVPNTGSTAALLGAGVVALAFARRRLG